jgi:amidase
MSFPSPDLWRWDAVDLARAIAAGTISSREAVQASLDRMAAVNPALNAIVVPLPDEALAAAGAADAAVRRGEALGPLHGVPISIKINVDQKGQATSNGVVAFKDAVAAEDSAVVANLRAAGAVIIGRSNTPAFSMRWATENDLHGRTLNPWSPDHTPGGSSGGASASVAAGITPIGHGNDLAGSVRYPAWCTGIAGLRPSFGRVPAFNPSMTAERPLSLQLMSVQGPLARRIADLRLALAVMARGDARDPWWVPAPLAGEPPPRPLRVALSTDPTGSGLHPHNAGALQAAAAALTTAGYVVEPMDPPDMAAIAADWNVLARFEAPHFLLPTIYAQGDEGIRRAARWHLDVETPTAEAYMEALARRTSWIRQWTAFLAHTPLLLCPVSLAPPFRHGADIASAESFHTVMTSQAPSFAIPLLGLPAAAVPTGLHDGLPTGVQLVGPRFREDLVLDAAEVIERHCGRLTPIDPR